MAISTVIITDRNFRITIPYEIRIAENLKIGDIIEINIVKYSSTHDEINNIKDNIKNLTNLVEQKILMKN